MSKQEDNMSLIHVDGGTNTASFGEVIEPGIPSELLKSGSEKDVFDFAVSRLAALDNFDLQMEITAAYMKNRLMIEQGAIFSAIKEKFGRPGLKRFSERFGCSIRTAYNYIDHFDGRDLVVMTSLHPSKVLRLLALKKREDIEFQGEKIIFHVGDTTKEMTISDAQGMTFADFADLVDKYKGMEKRVAKSDKETKKIETIYDKALKEEQRKNAELELRIRFLENQDATAAEIDAAIKDIGTQIAQTGRQIVAITRRKELSDAQRGAMHAHVCHLNGLISTIVEETKWEEIQSN